MGTTLKPHKVNHTLYKTVLYILIRYLILAESVVTYAGERFDFILNADQPKDLYWMRFRGLMDCDERFTSAHQEAIIEYDGVDGELPSGPEPDYLQANRTGLVGKFNCLFQEIYNRRVSFLANKPFK